MKKRLNPASPAALVESLFAEAERQEVTIDAIARKAGLDSNTLTNWKRGHTTPGVFLFNAALNVLGLELRICPRTAGGPSCK